EFEAGRLEVFVSDLDGRGLRVLLQCGPGSRLLRGAECRRQKCDGSNEQRDDCDNCFPVHSVSSYDFRFMIELANFIQSPPLQSLGSPRCDSATGRKMRGGSASICATGVSPTLKMGITGIRGAYAHRSMT